LVEPLVGSRTFEEAFDHLHAGIDAREQGEGDQRITSFVNTDVVSLFRDHFVLRRELVLDENPIVCPTATSEGSVNVGYEFDYKSTQEGITGIGLVLYLEDAEHDWHIAAGANPETLELEALGKTEGKNSKNAGPVAVRLERLIPKGLAAQRRLVLVHTKGRLSDTEGKARGEFTPAEIARLESLGRITPCN
jgi:hypothetical protein